MSASNRTWWQTMLHIVRSTLTLVRAEAHGLQGELRHGGTLLRELAVLGAVAFVFAFFAVGLLLTAGLLGLSLVVPAWAAALILGCVLLCVILAIGLRMRAVAREMESPAGVVKRRVTDHVEWWRSEVVSQLEPPTRPSGSRTEESGGRHE